MAARVGISARDVYSRVKPQGKADLVAGLQQQVRAHSQVLVRQERAAALPMAQSNGDAREHPSAVNGSDGLQGSVACMPNRAR